VAIGDSYHKLIELRREGLRKYRAQTVFDVCAPPFRVSFPTIGLRQPDMPYKKFGPVYVGDNPPILAVVERCVRASTRALTVLEIGPGPGSLAFFLKRRYGARIARYFALERDEAVEGPYDRIPSPEAVPAGVDLLIASEVAEHMTADDFFGGILASVLRKLAPDAAMVLGTPNALSPGAIFRDVTHVQGYPWYDLYALMRLSFASVDIYRMHYATSETHILGLIPRIVMTAPLDLDWCENLVCHARQPIIQ